MCCGEELLCGCHWDEKFVLVTILQEEQGKFYDTYAIL